LTFHVILQDPNAIISPHLDSTVKACPCAAPVPGLSASPEAIHLLLPRLNFRTLPHQQKINNLQSGSQKSCEKVWWQLDESKIERTSGGDWRMISELF